MFKLKATQLLVLLLVSSNYEPTRNPKLGIVWVGVPLIVAARNDTAEHHASGGFISNSLVYSTGYLQKSDVMLIRR